MTIDYLEENMEKNCDNSFNKSIVHKMYLPNYVNLHYQLLMKNNVFLKNLKIYLRINTKDWL